MEFLAIAFGVVISALLGIVGWLLNQQFDQLNARFDKIDARFDQINDRFGQIDGDFTELRSEMNEGFTELRRGHADTRERLARIETQIGIGIPEHLRRDPEPA